MPRHAPLPQQRMSGCDMPCDACHVQACGAAAHHSQRAVMCGIVPCETGEAGVPCESCPAGAKQRTCPLRCGSLSNRTTAYHKSINPCKGRSTAWVRWAPGCDPSLTPLPCGCDRFCTRCHLAALVQRGCRFAEWLVWCGRAGGLSGRRVEAGRTGCGSKVEHVRGRG